VIAFRLRSSTRRLLMLVGLAVIIGLVAGGAAYLLVRTIGLITHIVFFGDVAWGAIPPISSLDPSPRLPIAAAIGALIIASIATVAPVIRGHGIPEAMEAVLRRDSRIAPRTAIAKPISAAIAIGTGGPFGAEGPIIVTGGAIGSLVGQILKVTPSERKILLASGAAAGMAATFGAPLASILLAIELLLFELSIRSLIPLTVATSIAGGIHSAVFGTGPLFSAPAHDYAGLGKLPVYAVLGLTSGLLAVLIARGLFAAERSFRSLRVPIFWHPLIGSLVFAGIGLLVPRSLGVGYNVIDDVLAGRLALLPLAAVLVAKMVSWWVALGSGTSGGTLAPVLLIGASFGGLFATVALDIVPGLNISEGAFAMVGMAAVFGAATGAPLTAMVFVFEITRDFEVVLPLMMATVLSALVFSVLSDESIYTEKLSRRGIRVGNELVADSLRTTAVADVMNRVVDSVAPDDMVGEIADRITRGEHGAFPVVDSDGRLLGMVTRRDLLTEDHPRDAPISEVTSTDLVTLGPEASLVDAMQLMAEEDVTHIPVIEDGVIIGICTRADIVRSRSDELALERLEPGWLAPVVQRRNRVGRRIIVVGNESLGGPPLMAELTGRAEREPSVRFHIVVPLPTGGDLTAARERLEMQLGLLEHLGVEASGEIGSSDPLAAIEAAVRREPASEIVLSMLPPSRSRWLRSNLPSGIARRIDLPCTVVHDDENRPSSSPTGPG
jgi:H+/Cl- antiporter ClcA/predicted transcriptional regulator